MELPSSQPSGLRTFPSPQVVWVQNLLPLVVLLLHCSQLDFAGGRSSRRGNRVPSFTLLGVTGRCRHQRATG